MIITLTGFMGCGKSSVGRELHDLIGWPLEDLDDHIEAAQGRSIPEIFSRDGEAAFRSMELQAFREVVSANEKSSKGLILSLGGGTLTTPECAKVAKERTFCVYLKASTDTLVANLLEDGVSGRPMLSGAGSPVELRDKVEDLMSRRAAVYEAAASAVIPIDGMDFSAVARAIADTLKAAR